MRQSTQRRTATSPRSNLSSAQLQGAPTHPCSRTRSLLLPGEDAVLPPVHADGLLFLAVLSRLGLAGGQSTAGTNQSVWYSSRSSWGYSPGSTSLPGDVFLPSQFDGFSSGDLNMQVVSEVSETLSSAGFPRTPSDGRGGGAPGRPAAEAAPPSASRRSRSWGAALSSTSIPAARRPLPGCLAGAGAQPVPGLLRCQVPRSA